VRAVLQRVSSASVAIDRETVGRIGHGLVVLVGVAAGDGQADIEYIASKVCDVRIFADDHGRMNRAVRDVGGALLVISQFTLLGDARQGRRPAFDAAEKPDDASRIYDEFVARLKATGLPVESGRFRAHMEVELVNDGPVTILLDSRKLF
jgi:D-tyrosyl-tRNA(Tyr) deacylase